MNALVVFLTCSVLGADASAANVAVRAAIERSLPFIQAEGDRWITEKKCVTCHQVPFMVWALNAAAERGIELDRAKREECDAWARDWKNMATKEDLDKGEEFTLARHNDPVAQLLLARGKDNTNAPWAATFAERLAAGQQADGSWKAGGQLPGQKRPERETHEVTTMWSLVALHSSTVPREAIANHVSHAREWLGNKTAAESTEWWAVRLLLERGSGNPMEADRLRGDLLGRQHKDGGWGWLVEDESDAFGTGVALYALLRDGLPGNDSNVARAFDYLVRTQQSNGSWPVKGTKKPKAKQIEPTATYWGTCWAVIGLAEMLASEAR